MARRSKPGSQHTGLYYAREARGMSRSELVRLSGVSKQQLSRLENGLIRLRLDHLKPFANALGYSPEQILLWGRFPGTGAIRPRLKLSAQVSTPRACIAFRGRPHKTQKAQRRSSCRPHQVGR